MQSFYHLCYSTYNEWSEALGFLGMRSVHLSIGIWIGGCFKLVLGHPLGNRWLLDLSLNTLASLNKFTGLHIDCIHGGSLATSIRYQYQ